MSEIYKQRMTASQDEDFVVFIIGMRINKYWKIHKWLPVSLAMPKMLKELYANPELGLLSHEQWFAPTPVLIQYWKSFDHLTNYAKNNTSHHLPAWKDFNRKIASNGDIGIWHETYQVKKDNYECIYNNMPLFGLAKAGQHLPATGNRESAVKRMRGDKE